jgi:hypothetical protein
VQDVPHVERREDVQDSEVTDRLRMTQAGLIATSAPLACSARANRSCPRAFASDTMSAPGTVRVIEALLGGR